MILIGYWRSLMEIKDIIDRFEILFSNSKISDLRRAYNDKDLSSIFRLIDTENVKNTVNEYDLEDLRKSVLERNLHSIFRLFPNDELRKLVLEDNIWSLWRLLDKEINTQFIPSLKYLISNDINFDKDCFSQGQVKSKLWLIEELEKLNLDLGTVFLCAGWYATLATMIFESNLQIEKIRSFDIDSSCIEIAERFNKPWEIDNWKFKAVTKNIHEINYSKEFYEVIKPDGVVILNDSPDTIINTSCEHIENFASWYNSIPNNKLVVLQTNNYFEIEDHVNCSASLEEFEYSTPMINCLYSGSLDLPKYTRFMRIGYK